MIWTIVALLALMPAAVWLLVAIGHLLFALTLHVRDRNKAPAPGDVWVQDMTTDVYVTRIADNGCVVVQNYPPNTRPFVGMVWSESPDSWRRRVRTRNMYRRRPR